MVSLKLAILGTRGVPPNYGGFETFAAELGTRLIRRGHEVSVYCRENQSAVGSRQSAVDEADAGAVEGRGLTADRRLPTADSSWNGIHRIVLPTIGHKYFETVSHAFLSALDACGATSSGAGLQRRERVRAAAPASGAIPVAINVDGIERKRRQWNVLGRMVYAIGEAFSVSFANAVIATRT